LIDGVVHDGRALLRLHARSRRWPPLLAPEIVARGAIFCTATGNRYFGQWLMDDCATYPLAVAEGAPITTAQPVNVHTLDYEQRLDMRPRRVGSAYVPELVIFHDVGQNPDKRRRVQAMRDRLFPAGGGAEHAGVFILRGATGQRRVLRNELELAERLRDRRGLRIVDPARADVETIVRTCAGARMVVGVEGSGLMHGILALRAGGAIVTLQPPSRFVGLYKDLADRDDQAFAFVVGLPEGEDFRVDPDEVERTLDLLPG
jgi:capsular polysaccharide biosynthesis protein